MLQRLGTARAAPSSARERAPTRAGAAGAPLALLAACAPLQQPPPFARTSDLCRAEAVQLCASYRADFAQGALCEHRARLHCLRALGWEHVGHGAWQLRGPAAEIERELERRRSGAAHD